jgi:hypothetical protein
MAGPSPETAIWLALKARIATLPASIVPQTSISLPKEAFTPPKSGTNLLPYLQVQHLPNQTERIFIKGDAPHRRPGILQLSLMVPNTGSWDFTVTTERAGLIAAHFPADLRLTGNGVSLRIELAPSIAQGFPDGAYWKTPISVRYDCFA